MVLIGCIFSMQATLYLWLMIALEFSQYKYIHKVCTILGWVNVDKIVVCLNQTVCFGAFTLWLQCIGALPDSLAAAALSAAAVPQCRGSALDHPRANLPTEHIKLFGCELHKHINMVRASRGVPRHILLLPTFFRMFTFIKMWLKSSMFNSLIFFTNPSFLDLK